MTKLQLTIITGAAAAKATSKGHILKEVVVPGWMMEDTQAVSKPRLRVAPDSKDMKSVHEGGRRVRHYL